MEILDRIIGELKDAIKYFKQRTKNKYYGDRFEEWVVKNSNISKDGISAFNNGNPVFWRLLEWRGDKYVDGYRPFSSSSPDLLLECMASCSNCYKSGERIAVECKWKSKESFFIDKECIEKYESYISANDSKFPIRCLFYVFGFGWSCDKPESVYVIPAKELYSYNKETREITFQIGESTADKANRLARYKHKDIRKCLYYLPYREKTSYWQ